MKRLLCFLISIIFLSFSITAFAQNDKYESAQIDLILSKDSVMAQDEFMLTLSFKNASSYPHGICAFTSTLTFDESAFTLQKVNYTVDEVDITTNSSQGIYKSLYVFAPDANSKGFSDDGPFYTAYFKVKDNVKSGKYEFGIDFDTISGVDYIGGEAQIFSVDFNKPTISVEVVNTQISSQVKDDINFIKDDDAEFTQPQQIQIDSQASVQSESIISSIDSNISNDTTSVEILEDNQSSVLTIGPIDQNDQQNIDTQKNQQIPQKTIFTIIFIIVLAIILVIVIIIVVNRKNKN